MEEAQESATEQMRAAVEKLGSSTEGETESNLMRFLGARSMDPKKAARMFIQWKKWRAEIAPLGYIPDDQVLDELCARKIFLQGPSKRGFGVFIIQARKHFAPKEFLQLKRFVVHILDKVLLRYFYVLFLLLLSNSLGPLEDLVKYRVSPLTRASLDQRLLYRVNSFADTAVAETTDYYPQRLAKVFIVSMPLIFVGAWKIVSSFLSKTTLDKVEIVKSEEGRMAMLEEIGAETLPVEYGGNAKLVPLQDVKLKYNLPVTAG